MDLRVSPDPSVNYDAACDTRHGGTVAWYTQGNAFTRGTESGSLLWIHGKPGSGESVLSPVIIRDLSDSDSAGSACVVYIYFDFKDTEKQDLRALSSSLL